jgi:cyclophilin family peptidyl-prolyl cis-trans isomerase/HEAT repeat protein
VKLFVLLASAALFLSVIPGIAAEQNSERLIAASEARRAVDAKIVALLDGEPALAARAALALGRSKKNEARPILRAKLAAPDATLRAMAAYALGLLEDQDALEAERRLAREDNDSAVRYAAIDAIGRIANATPALASRAVADEMLAILRTDRDPAVRGHAAAALEVFRNLPDGDTKAIAAALTDAFERERDRSVRWHTMWSIFRGYSTLVDRVSLGRALTDSDELVRIAAVRAWGRRGSVDADAAVLVKPLLEDSSWRVQLQARESLHALAKEPLTDHLTVLPEDLHLPRADRPNREDSLPRPMPAPSTGAPSLDDLLDPLPLLARTAADLNGPMHGKHPRVRIRTTKGDIVLRLYPEWAPNTVANFLKLTNRGYFDGNRWFRIVPDFVVQTGDPNDNGEGDAGYTIPAEENPIEQRAGIIAMGLNYKDNRAIRDSAGTQFYITVSPQLHLDRDFTVFGEVESGMNSIARLIESDRMMRVERLLDR